MDRSWLPLGLALFKDGLAEYFHCQRSLRSRGRNMSAKNEEAEDEDGGGGA